MGVGKDRISELHDSLIHHVFSFLPINCVVATSILSKRWKDLWRTVHVLDIVDFEVDKSFVRFLDTMVLPSPPSLPIKKFCLDYCGSDNLFDNGRVYDWISTLVMRKIEDLSLCLRRDFLLPPSLFTCETLTELEIEMAGNLSSKNKKAGNLGFPPTISFSRLKVLYLTHIVFVDENLVTQLFSNTPILEELMLNQCCMKGTNVLCVSVASLKRLFITDHTARSWNLRINFDSPNLQSLTYTGMPEDFVLTGHGFPSLVHADIDMAIESVNRYTKKGKERLRGLKHLVEGILNVKFLTISGDPIVYLYFERLLTEVSSFPNLRQLEVSSELSDETAGGLFYFLNWVPNLESIIFAQGLLHLSMSDFLPHEEVPECLLLRLKAAEFRQIIGTQRERDVIEFFLKYSLVLQKMTIAFHSSLPQCWKDFVTRIILMFPKGAASSVINFL